MTDQALVLEAIAAREKSYSPYSGFMVGAALLTESGKVYRGCNIENAAYTPSNCAERTAFFNAVLQGEREFAAIAVAGWPKSGTADMVYPCGVCRQVMMEFCTPATFKVIVAIDENTFSTHTLQELLPHAFGPTDLA